MRLASFPLVACALLGCEWSTELKTDPAGWSPLRSGADDVDATSAADDADTIDPACHSRELPVLDPTLQTSTAARMSHLAGVPCLEGCHAEGGEAHTVFAVAGTIYRSQTSRETAGSGGTVDGVGATSLTVDPCGNFYAVLGALKMGVETTQPYVQSSTVQRMEKVLRYQNNPGSCNQNGCHDFSTRLKWGIYF